MKNQQYKNFFKFIFFILFGLFLIGGLVYATNVFPTDENDWSDGEVIESDWANQLEYRIGANATTSKSTLTYQVNTLMATTSFPGLSVIGTITTGVWQGTAIGAQYGGTGINSSALTGIAQIVSGTWSASSTLSTAFGGTGWGNLQANTVLLGNGAGRLATTSAGTDGYVLALSAGVPTWLATSTLSTITGTLAVSKGGTGQTSFGQGWLHSDGTTLTSSTSPTVNYITATSTATSTFAGSLAITETNATSTFAGGIDISDGCFAIDGTCLTAGSGTVTSVAMTTPTFLSISGSPITTSGTLALTLSGTALPITSGGTGQTSFGQGWLNSDGTTLSASTSPTVNYLTATSTTATSTFAGGLKSDKAVQFPTFANCNIDTDADGFLVCGSDSTGSAVGTVSTSSTPTIGNLAYWTSAGYPSLLGTVATSTPTMTAPLTYSGTLGSFVGGVAGTFDCTSATGSVKGCLTSTDWTTFNGKQAGDATLTALAGLTISAGSLITGTGADAFSVLAGGTNGYVLAMSGSAPAWVATTTLSTISGTLDISAQSNLTAGTGITLTNDDLSIDTSQNIATLSNLTGNGFVKTSGGAGTLSVDTSTYLTAVGNVVLYPAFTYATSSASFTGTTTIPLGVAQIAETWNSVSCFTDAGTVWLAFDDGTNVMEYLQASTTVGIFTLSTNNSFSALEKRYVKFGNAASSPTKISCTIKKTISAN